MKANAAQAFFSENINIIGCEISKNGKDAIFYDNPVAFKEDKNKRSEVRSNVMKLSLITKILSAEGNSKTTITETDKPTTIITADMQEYNTETRIMKAKGNVVITHNDVIAKADVGYAYLDNNNEVKKIEDYIFFFLCFFMV